LAPLATRADLGTTGIPGLTIPQISGKPSYCSPGFRIPPAQRCTKSSQTPKSRKSRVIPGDLNGPLQPKVCIDLTLDLDDDGLPDELVAAIDHIRQLPPSRQTAAILELVTRLPYSESTLNLQAQAALATLQLEGCNLNEVQQHQLATKLQDLLDAMTTDPEYTAAQQFIKAILAKDFAVQFPVPPAPGVPACELTETSTGPTCVPFNLNDKQFCFLQKVTTGDTFCEVRTSPTPPVRPPDEFGWNHLAKGDLLLRESSSPIWRTLEHFFGEIKYSHGATWNGDRSLYEAIETGVVVTNLVDWVIEGDAVAIGENNLSPGLEEVALSLGQQRYGTDGRTPFDIVHFDKNIERFGVYCTQIMWRMQMFIGTDIDSQNWEVALYLVARWGTVGADIGSFFGPLGSLIGGVFGGSAGLLVAQLAVLPDEIYFSDKVRWYYIGEMPGKND
jgi:hypothetical protein